MWQEIVFCFAVEFLHKDQLGSKLLRFPLIDINSIGPNLFYNVWNVYSVVFISQNGFVNGQRMEHCIQTWWLHL